MGSNVTVGAARFGLQAEALVDAEDMRDTE